jgi:hypothetical protein
MLFSALFIYNQLRRLGRDQIRAGGGRPGVADVLGRWSQRWSRGRGNDQK